MSNPIPPEARVQVYVDPAVKEFTTALQLDLKPWHFRRARSTLGLSYTRTDYLLHVHAGHLPARPIDAPALEDLERAIARRREALAA